MTTLASRRTGSPALVAVYAVLSVVGLVGTWYFNLAFFAQGGTDYLGGWFANAASSSAAVDIIVMAVAACIVMVVEGRRLAFRPLVIGLLVVLSFVIAVAFTFPLFLALREVRLRRT
ncbi:DUF2834 domain-containing protein [Actinomycetospora straminea]|uniref:DUF2834 domain-containing protein n=1 Tax=Actinomycetospora straminea TaxID=663607 RepID=A0ABP9ELR2_9PSEU|nr:DUF2834 domain-containing protein [Actinomycetospora straminea]MDD7935082.1 DUF2834 domain-containing protein [Actinomycetospora straminea]